MTMALLDEFPSALASTGLPSVLAYAPTVPGGTMVAISSVLGVSSDYLPMDVTVEMGQTGQLMTQLSSGTLGHSDASATLGIGQTWQPSGRAPKSARHERELSWLAAHRDQLRTFAGEWIVIRDDEIIAHHKDPLKAVRQARAKGIKNPLVYKVEGERPKGIGQLGL